MAQRVSARSVVCSFGLGLANATGASAETNGAAAKMLEFDRDIGLVEASVQALRGLCNSGCFHYRHGPERTVELAHRRS